MVSRVSRAERCRGPNGKSPTKTWGRTVISYRPDLPNLSAQLLPVESGERRKGGQRGSVAGIDASGVQRTSAMRATVVRGESTANTAAIGRIRNRRGAVVYSIDELWSAAVRVGRLVAECNRVRDFGPRAMPLGFTLPIDPKRPSRTGRGRAGSWPTDGAAARRRSDPRSASCRESSPSRRTGCP
jgi:hypothetical protein